LLDSGASTTCLHPQDAVLRLQIDPARLASPRDWPDQRSHTGIGGASTYYRHPIRYAFLHDDGQWRELPTGEISIAQLKADNQALPSLLGWDVLQNFVVVLDWPNRRITLSN
jgi:hypothetical protein